MIKNIGIIGGSGKIGSTFRKSFESVGLKVLVTDDSSKNLEDELIEKSDWVILSVPIDKTLEVFNSIKDKIRKDQVFSDFTSVKSILDNQTYDFEFVSCHPLFGPLNTIEGQNIVTIPVSEGSLYTSIIDIFSRIGLKITEMKSLREHDKYMSLIQGMTHFSHVCFTTAMKKLDLDFDKVMEICSPIYQSNISFSSRITGGDENLYTNIIMDNPANKEVLQMYLDTSSKLLDMVKNQNYEDFKSNFNDNREYLKNHLSDMIDQSNFLIDKMAEFKKGSKD
ncbi:MAG: prephenate dehydrogenase/arogenate dehydrogenase family protein [Cytophagales bacterium]